jgi:hypothetical protein
VSHQMLQSERKLLWIGRRSPRIRRRFLVRFADKEKPVYREPDLGVVWLNRHQDAASMEVARSAFSHRKVQRTVTAANRQAGQRFETLYQRAIDFGGHPNERSVTGNMSMIEEPDRRLMLGIFLHADGPAFDMALKTTAQCGVCSLEILQGVFSALFELLGVNAAMLELRKGL